MGHVALPGSINMTEYVHHSTFFNPSVLASILTHGILNPSDLREKLGLAGCCIYPKGGSSHVSVSTAAVFQTKAGLGGGDILSVI